MNGTNSSEVQVARLEVKVAHLESQLLIVNLKLDTVLEKLSEAKGGWRTLMWLGGAAGTLGAGVAWGLSHLKVSL